MYDGANNVWYNLYLGNPHKVVTIKEEVKKLPKVRFIYLIQVTKK